MLFSKSKNKLVLMLDVQSSIIRGTLVHMSETHVPQVLHTYLVKIPYKAHARSGYLVKMALKGVGETTGEILRYLHGMPVVEGIPRKISEVTYVLSSPWVVSQAKTLTLDFEKETSITKSYITNIIAEERKRLANGINDDLRVIEEKVFDIRLNGYSVASWEGKKTLQLAVSFVVSIAGGRTIDRLVEACDHIVHKRDVSFHSSLFLQHLGIQKIFSDTASYALIHIHGELTDVAIVENNSCTFFGSYPFGTHSVIRTIARESKIDEQSAESLLSMYIQNQLDSVHAEKEQAIVQDMINGWIGEFQKLLKTNTPVPTLPHHVIISAHSHEQFFIKSLETAYPGHTLELLAIESLIPHVSFGTPSEHLRLTGLYAMALESLYTKE